jgi:hypothetical protein
LVPLYDIRSIRFIHSASMARVGWKELRPPVATPADHSVYNQKVGAKDLTFAISSKTQAAGPDFLAILW